MWECFQTNNLAHMPLDNFLRATANGARSQVEVRTSLLFYEEK
jgi:hypothetical protein